MDAVQTKRRGSQWGVDQEQPKRPGSWWSVDPKRPRKQGSRQGTDLVIPQGPDEQKRLRGVGLIGRYLGVVWIRCSPRGRGPNGAWIQCRSGAWHSLRGVDLGGVGAWIRHGAVAQHSPREGESRGAEHWLCRPTGLGLGRPAVILLDVAWRILLWSKGLECHIFGSFWCFTPTKYVSNISAGSLVEELTRSVVLSQLPSWSVLIVSFFIYFYVCESKTEWFENYTNCAIVPLFVIIKSKISVSMRYHILNSNYP
jgi:hypothetical protein